MSVLARRIQKGGDSCRAYLKLSQVRDGLGFCCFRSLYPAGLPPPIWLPCHNGYAVWHTLKAELLTKKNRLKGGFSKKVGPSDRIRTCGILLPNGSYDGFSRSFPLVFRPAVRCNTVVARYAEFLSGTVRKCVFRCPLSGCGCDCGSSFWVLLNVLREYRQLTRPKTVATPTGNW